MSLPVSNPHPQLPRIEYVRVFDLAHAALLAWSPTVVTSLSVSSPAGLCGHASDVSLVPIPFS